MCFDCILYCLLIPFFFAFSKLPGTTILFDPHELHVLHVLQPSSAKYLAKSVGNSVNVLAAPLPMTFFDTIVQMRSYVP